VTDERVTAREMSGAAPAMAPANELQKYGITLARYHDISS
jgi:hypothetical protein